MKLETIENEIKAINGGTCTGSDPGSDTEDTVSTVASEEDSPPENVEVAPPVSRVPILDEAHEDMEQYEACQEVDQATLLTRGYPSRMFVPPEEGRRVRGVLNLVLYNEFTGSGSQAGANIKDLFNSLRRVDSDTLAQADLSRAFYSVRLEAEDGVALPGYVYRGRNFLMQRLPMGYRYSMKILSLCVEDMLGHHTPTRSVVRAIYADNIIYSAQRQDEGVLQERIREDEKILNRHGFRWKPGSVETLPREAGASMVVLGYNLFRRQDGRIGIGVKYRVLPEVWNRRSLLQWSAKCYDELGIAGSGAIKARISAFATAGILTSILPRN
ncbi:hypothetical protein Pmar_PMAR021231 [Perkinsus marinus ATCC 50983]|uniref:Reverse transcriptase domain-containing protein n=1 Tax=Perkinsus marinus (strain ATCC 50983 / TXsc) TaxID=423536 RepID=C5LRE8_PERM5|nr:hypothetical protein Pmar_PMAR021231 [Perkinsus marinus ATCC 50983]EER00696.1 hypothetical protein Pmar_PMAR021231 [Perkinsus marinus ATCC 50983]|eukprot:XP_002767978.1 hypothetical protein Pmar_PMAR021231 [Perkinsus marinus ATCC 50983]